MIWVVSIPRTGTTFVMELLKNLGNRIFEGWTPEWRGGNEDQEFNDLGVILNQWLYLPYVEDTAPVPEGGWLVWREAIKEGDIRVVLDRVWSKYDALKDVTGGHMLPVSAGLGYKPEAVIITLRSLFDLQEKYGQIPVHLPSRMRSPAMGYGVWGLTLYCCELWEIPYSVMMFPRFLKDKSYAEDRLGSLGIGSPTCNFEEAWEKAHLVKD